MDDKISGREYGRLEARVEELEKKIDVLVTQMGSLLEIANKSKGALWFGMLLAGSLGSAATWIAHSLGVIPRHGG